jgi:ABC-type multidrug transport system ATPase subunit
MPVQLERIGKKYNREWIFRGVDHAFHENEPCVVLGSNGSGKSTLLQVVSGAVRPSEGKITYTIGNQAIAAEEIFTHVTLATPYLELLEELTLAELVSFQEKFKPWRDGMHSSDVIAATGLTKAQHKTLRHFSSGMKQRARLALAVLADTRILLLDEPCSNLDAAGIAWYQQLVEANQSDRIILVCSNRQEYEYPFCTQEIRIEDFKK